MTDAIDLDPKPEPFVPDWLTIGTTVAFLAGGQYGAPPRVERVTVKTIGKRDIIVTYTRHGQKQTERFRHTDYERRTGTEKDTYSKWVSNGRMGGRSYSLMALDNPRLKKIELQSNADLAVSNVRTAMRTWEPSDSKTTRNLIDALTAHDEAAANLDAFKDGDVE